MAKNNYKKFNDIYSNNLELLENPERRGIYFVRGTDEVQFSILEFTRAQLEEIADYIKGLP